MTAPQRPASNSDARKRAEETAHRELMAAVWDEGHAHPWRRGPDDCRCSAWSSSECGCGRYGTGPLVSLDDNPYRGQS